MKKVKEILEIINDLKEVRELLIILVDLHFKDAQFKTYIKEKLSLEEQRKIKGGYI